MKLTIELVPKTAWYSNVRDILTKNQWDIVRKRVYSESYDVCQICGGVGSKHPVEAHEIWHYDDAAKIQRLDRILALCPKCHQVKHIGLAQLRGKFEVTIKHFMKINKMERTEAIGYVSSQFRIWQDRSEHQWKLDIDKLKDYGIEVDKLTLK